jgi:hypothetical protein
MKNKPTPNPFVTETQPEGTPSRSGFYSPGFIPDEVQDLSCTQPDKLDDEIDMLRIVTRRAVEIMETDLPLKDLINCYRVIGQMCRSVASLMRANKSLQETTNPREDLFEALAESAQKFLEERKLEKGMSAPNAGSDELRAQKPLDFYSPISFEPDSQAEE